MTTSTEGLGYAEALSELQQILNEIERPDIDVDQLAVRVERAGVLISFCRERIDRARVQIDQAVGNLGAAPAGDDTSRPESS